MGNYVFWGGANNPRKGHLQCPEREGRVAVFLCSKRKSLFTHGNPAFRRTAKEKLKLNEKENDFHWKCSFVNLIELFPEGFSIFPAKQ